MAILAVVCIADNKLDRVIVAEMSDYCPEGFYFVELPLDHTWHKGQIVPHSYSGIQQLQVF